MFNYGINCKKMQLVPFFIQFIPKISIFLFTC